MYLYDAPECSSEIMSNICTIRMYVVQLWEFNAKDVQMDDAETKLLRHVFAETRQIGTSLPGQLAL